MWAGLGFFHSFFFAITSLSFLLGALWASDEGQRASQAEVGVGVAALWDWRVPVHPPSEPDRRHGPLALTLNVWSLFSALIPADLLGPPPPAPPCSSWYFLLRVLPIAFMQERIKVLQGSASVYWLQLPDSIYFYGIVRIFILRSPYYSVRINYVTNQSCCFLSSYNQMNRDPNKSQQLLNYNSVVTTLLILLHDRWSWYNVSIWVICLIRLFE